MTDSDRSDPMPHDGCVVYGGWGGVALSYPPQQPHGPTRPGGGYVSRRFRLYPEPPDPDDPVG